MLDILCRCLADGQLNQRNEGTMNKPVRAKNSMGMQSLLIATAMFAVAGPLISDVSGGGRAVAAETYATEMRHYKNDQWKFELDVPTAWAVMPPDLSNSPNEIIRMGSQENGKHNLIVFRQSVSPSKDAKRLTDESQRFLAKHGFSNFVSKETVIGAHKVMTLDFERNIEGGVWHCRHYIIVDEAKAYVLGFGTTNREAMSELYDRMAKSFVFRNT
jgi:hypothetical protein